VAFSLAVVSCSVTVASSYVLCADVVAFSVGNLLIGLGGDLLINDDDNDNDGNDVCDARISCS
jgi:hypothetical protein